MQRARLLKPHHRCRGLRSRALNHTVGRNRRYFCDESSGRRNRGLIFSGPLLPVVYRPILTFPFSFPSSRSGSRCAQIAHQRLVVANDDGRRLSGVYPTNLFKVGNLHCHKFDRCRTICLAGSRKVANRSCQRQAIRNHQTPRAMDGDGR